MKFLLQKSVINHYYVKVKKKIFDQKKFIEKLFKVNEKNNLGVLRINQIISKLLTLSKRS